MTNVSKTAVALSIIAVAVRAYVWFSKFIILVINSIFNKMSFLVIFAHHYLINIIKINNKYLMLLKLPNTILEKINMANFSSFWELCVLFIYSRLPSYTAGPLAVLVCTGALLAVCHFFWT